MQKQIVNGNSKISTTSWVSIGLLITITVAAVAWGAIHQQVQVNTACLATIPDKYVPRSEYDATMKSINETLHRIESKLDRLSEEKR